MTSKLNHILALGPLHQGRLQIKNNVPIYQIVFNLIFWFVSIIGRFTLHLTLPKKMILSFLLKQRIEQQQVYDQDQQEGKTF